MHQALSEIDLVSAQTHQFRDSQTVTIGDQDQGGIAKSVAPLSGRSSDYSRDLLFGQIFPVAILGIRLANGNFPFYDGWSRRGGAYADPGFLGGGFPNFPHFTYYMETLSFGPFFF